MEQKIDIGTRGLYYTKEPYCPPCILKSINLDCPDEISIPTLDEMRYIYELENPDGIIYEASFEDIATSWSDFLSARLGIIAKELMSISKYLKEKTQ